MNNLDNHFGSPDSSVISNFENEAAIRSLSPKKVSERLKSINFDNLNVGVYDSIINQSNVTNEAVENEYICLKELRFVNKAGRNCLGQRGDIISFKEVASTKYLIQVLKEMYFIADTSQITDGLRQYAINNTYDLKMYGLEHLTIPSDWLGAKTLFITLPKDNANVGSEYLKLAQEGKDISETRRFFHQKSERLFKDDVKNDFQLYPKKEGTNSIIEMNKLVSNGHDVLNYYTDLMQH